MIAPVEVRKIVANMDGESFDVVKKYETIDAMWGMEHMVLTNEDIKALKNGEYLYHTDGEYAQIISYKEESDG